MEEELGCYDQLITERTNWNGTLLHNGKPCENMFKNEIKVKEKLDNVR